MLGLTGDEEEDGNHEHGNASTDDEAGASLPSLSQVALLRRRVKYLQKQLTATVATAAEKQLQDDQRKARGQAAAEERRCHQETNATTVASEAVEPEGSGLLLMKLKDCRRELSLLKQCYREATGLEPPLPPQLILPDSDVDLSHSGIMDGTEKYSMSPPLSPTRSGSRSQPSPTFDGGRIHALISEKEAAVSEVKRLRRQLEISAAATSAAEGKRQRLFAAAKDEETTSELNALKEEVRSVRAALTSASQQLEGNKVVINETATALRSQQRSLAQSKDGEARARRSLQTVEAKAGAAADAAAAGATEDATARVRAILETARRSLAVQGSRLQWWASKLVFSRLTHRLARTAQAALAQWRKTIMADTNTAAMSKGHRGLFVAAAILCKATITAANKAALNKRFTKWRLCCNLFSRERFAVASFARLCECKASFRLRRRLLKWAAAAGQRQAAAIAVCEGGGRCLANLKKRRLVRRRSHCFTVWRAMVDATSAEDAAREAAAAEAASQKAREAEASEQLETFADATKLLEGELGQLRNALRTERGKRALAKQVGGLQSRLVGLLSTSFRTWLQFAAGAAATQAAAATAAANLRATEFEEAAVASDVGAAAAVAAAKLAAVEAAAEAEKRKEVAVASVQVAAAKAAAEMAATHAESVAALEQAAHSQAKESELESAGLSEQIEAVQNELAAIQQQSAAAVGAAEAKVEHVRMVRSLRVIVSFGQASKHHGLSLALHLWQRNVHSKGVAASALHHILVLRRRRQSNANTFIAALRFCHWRIAATATATGFLALKRVIVGADRRRRRGLLLQVGIRRWQSRLQRISQWRISARQLFDGVLKPNGRRRCGMALRKWMAAMARTESGKRSLAKVLRAAVHRYNVAALRLLFMRWGGGYGGLGGYGSFQHVSNAPIARRTSGKSDGVVGISLSRGIGLGGNGICGGGTAMSQSFVGRRRRSEAGARLLMRVAIAARSSAVNRRCREVFSLWRHRVVTVGGAMRRFGWLLKRRVAAAAGAAMKGALGWQQWRLVVEYRRAISGGFRRCITKASHRKDLCTMRECLIGRWLPFARKAAAMQAGATMTRSFLVRCDAVLLATAFYQRWLCCVLLQRDREEALRTLITAAAATAEAKVIAYRFAQWKSKMTKSQRRMQGTKAIVDVLEKRR